MEKKPLTKEQELYIITQCKMMLEEGALEAVKDMVVVESEQRQLYSMTTDSQLEYHRRAGIEELFFKMKQFANRAEREKDVKDKYNPV